jgi:hypothetical protein
VTLTASGEPPIQFHAHQARAGVAGAREEFEQMLALLVQATSGPANLVFANPGDWGIDVLVGDLRGSARIWQAKYYINGVIGSHRASIEKSFESAVTAAQRNGYEVAQWVLCVPSSMDAPTRRWWDGWKASREASTGIRIELWDENTLRGLLLRPEASAVRRAFYHPYREDTAERPRSRPAVVAAGPDRRWRPGNEIALGRAVYLLHEDAVEQTTGTWRSATADRIGPTRLQVWLRQATGPAGDALREQARLLRMGVPGWPVLVEATETAGVTTVIVARPEGRSWREAFGPAELPPDRVTAANAVACAAQVCTALGRLHGLGQTHRALSPDTIFTTGHQSATVLRDLGQAGLASGAAEGAGPYRAAEQSRVGAGRGTPGPRTDVYQVAALVHHTLSGHPPLPSGTPPVRASMPGFPASLDGLLLRALAPDAAERPSMPELAAALRQARSDLSRGGGR